jgi:bifunctional non-homologous end joining protein LigD
MARSEYLPQLATLVKAPPSGGGWLHEIKFDGYRIGCRIRDGRVWLITRNGNDWTAAFPEIARAAAQLPGSDLLLDGEVVMVLADGRTSFQALQNAAAGEAQRDALTYFVFDLLRLDGAAISRRPIEERKDALRRLIGDRKEGRIRYAAHVEGDGATFFAQACQAGLEGIVSKRKGRPYQPGRHGDWLKTKCLLRQEFVVGGFTDPEGIRAGIGALLVGHYEGGRLVFAGKVGTGFSHNAAVDLRKRLDAIEQKASPFSPPPSGALGRRAHWVKPEYVCEVEFTEWTSDGKIRHPSFQGLRTDKKPQEVVREQPASPPAPPESVSRANARHVTVAGVRISHPDRVVYPDPPMTKADVARYYERIKDWILPHVTGRPLTLVRCPEGITGDCLYMKHSKVWAPEPLRRVRIQEKTKLGEYLIADTLSALVGLVQMGVLEIHTWNSRIENVERPNRIVIDLDPGERVSWAAVVQSARVVRKALEALDLDSFVKTTGGRGLHVVVPLAAHADWSECLEFSRALSEAIERTDPGLYTTQFSKAGREHKVLLDYLRNNRTNTSIAAYSTRARGGAPVSIPIDWSELRPSFRPASFTMKTVPERLARLAADPWKNYWNCRQTLTRQRQRAVQLLETR